MWSSKFEFLLPLSLARVRDLRIISWFYPKQQNFRNNHLDFHFTIEFIIVERVLGSGGTIFVGIFHKRNILLCGYKPNFV
jgi:hypothetical protein